MEIQSLGGIRPPEGGGLAYPCRVPLYIIHLYYTFIFSCVTLRKSNLFFQVK